MNVENDQTEGAFTWEWGLKHAAGQFVAPFVGDIVSHFHPNVSASFAENVQWTASSISAALLVEIQHRLFEGLQEKIGTVKSSIVAIGVPCTVTTSITYGAHTMAGTDAETSAKVVGTLSLLGYGSLQAFQLVMKKRKT